MKGKLIKGKTGYWLDDINRNLIASVTFKGVSDWKDKFLLSLKNYQAIENGYYLDELAKDYAINQLANPNEYEHSIYASTIQNTYMVGFQKALELMKHRLVEETEWQVEVLMDICGDKVYAVPEPVLDADGCLILKRKT